MSQQSNPATLREALATIRSVLARDLSKATEAVEQAKMQQSRMKFDHDNNDALVRYKKWQAETKRAIKVVEALAASGTEAAPSEDFDSDQTARVIQGHLSLSESDTALVKGYLHRAFVAGVEAVRNEAALDCICSDDEHSPECPLAQDAASPEGEGREAPLYTGELAAIDEELDEILGKRAADDVTSVLTRVHNALLRQSAAPSGALRLSEEILVDAARLIRRRKREGADNEEIEGCAMVCDAMRDDSRAQESKTGAVTETR